MKQKKFPFDAGSTISCKYYGLNDLSTGWEIKRLLDNYEDAKKFFLNNALESIQSIDDLRTYFLAKKYTEMTEVIPYVVGEENKKKFKDIIKACDKCLSSTHEKNVIKFIDNQYKRILNPSKSGQSQLNNAIFDFVIKNANGFHRSFWLYLAKNYSYILANNHTKLDKIFKKDYGPELLDLMIRTDQSPESVGFELEKNLQILVGIIKRKNDSAALYNIATQKLNQLYENVSNIDEPEDEQRLLMLTHTYHVFLDALKDINDGRANSFSEKTALLDKRLNEKMIETGTSTSFKIPLNEPLKAWRNSKIWEVRLLSLTHMAKEDNGVIQVSSRLSHLNCRKSIMDCCSTDTPTNAYFTVNRQLLLQSHSAINAGILFSILHHEKACLEYCKLVLSALEFIETQTTSCHGKTLSKNGKMLTDKLQQLLRNNNQPLDYYGIAMFTCALSEKLLRTLVKEAVKDEFYLPPNRFSLGRLLNPANEQYGLIKIFGKEHLKGLLYFLSKDSDGEVGQDLRNKLAHLTDEIEEDLDDNLICKLLWTFTDILNTVFWYHLEPTVNNPK